jgi:DHA1 family bicyclomycin/chloramphenicol resistance-like MFS transporter
LVVLAAAGALGSLATQMVIPVLPVIVHDLSISRFEAQLTIVVYLLGLATGQLGAGTATDRWGRRPVLLSGIAVFTLASLLASMAGGPALLLAARFCQAIGGACALVAGRSIVADTTQPGRSAQSLAALSSLLLISPIVAPTIGGTLAQAGGWRSIFITLAVSGLVVGTIACLLIPETAVERSAAPTLQSVVRLLRSRRFLALAIGNGLFAVALYAFLTVAPFLLINRFGQTPRDAGVALLWIALAAVIGTLLHRSAMVSARASELGRGIALAGAALFVALGWLLPPSALPLIAPMTMIGLGSGLSGPSLLAAALDVDRTTIGTASSLFGALQMAMSAAGTAIVGALGIDNGRSLGLTLLIVVGAACLVLMPTRRIRRR